MNFNFLFSCIIDDYADIISLAEEDAKSKKLLKKDCFVELVDIKTIE